MAHSICINLFTVFLPFVHAYPAQQSERLIWVSYGHGLGLINSSDAQYYCAYI